MDMFILILSYVTIGFSIYRTIQVNNLLDKLLMSNSKFESFDTLTFLQEVFNQASALVIFFAWIKVNRTLNTFLNTHTNRLYLMSFLYINYFNFKQIFKYISLNKTLDQLNATLRKSARDIMYFCIIFFIIFFAYGALGYLLFGETLADYQNFFTTL
jgi:hypothetical protein